MSCSEARLTDELGDAYVATQARHRITFWPTRFGIAKNCRIRTIKRCVRGVKYSGGR